VTWRIPLAEFPCRTVVLPCGCVLTEVIPRSIVDGVFVLHDRELFLSPCRVDEEHFEDVSGRAFGLFEEGIAA
jgi:hypothetical protein